MNDSQHAIRWARPSDLEQIVELCAEHAIFERAAYSREGKAELLARHLFAPQPRAWCLVADAPSGGLAGYATFTREFSTWDAAEFVHVDCLYLRAGARNRQLGWLFGKRIASETLALGIDAMQFQTPPFNESAIRIYAAMGAHRKDKVRFYADRHDMSRFVNSRGVPNGRRHLDPATAAAADAPGEHQC